MYVVTVAFSVIPEHVGSFAKAMNEQAETSLKEEEHCHQFDVAIDPDDSSAFFLYEIYSDKAAFEFHLKTPHFDSFNTKVSPWVASKIVKNYQRAWPE